MPSAPARGDRRHFKDRDDPTRRGRLLLTRMNLEMGLTEEMLGIALEGASA